MSWRLSSPIKGLDMGQPAEVHRIWVYTDRFRCAILVFTGATGGNADEQWIYTDRLAAGDR
jgi:hypothetical protein